MSTGGLPKNIPVKPPVTKIETKPIAKSIDVVNLIFAPQRVASQLKVLMAEGTAIIKVVVMNAVPNQGFMPLTNM